MNQNKTLVTSIVMELGKLSIAELRGIMDRLGRNHEADGDS